MASGVTRHKPARWTARQQAVLRSHRSMPDAPRRRRMLALLGAPGAVVLLSAVVPIPRAHPDLRSRPTMAGPAGEASGEFRELRWDELSSRHAHARQAAATLRERARHVPDSTRSAADLWDEMQGVQRLATGNPALQGVSVLITGYAVPLERSRDGVRELLLVPYFGACIHAPPPLADQVVHITLPAGLPNLKAMDVLAARGRLELRRHRSDLAASSYVLLNATAEVIPPKPQR